MQMDTTPNLGLEIVSESQESTTKVRDYRRSTSRNFEKLDVAVGDLQATVEALNDMHLYICSASETQVLGDGTNAPLIENPSGSIVYLVSSGDAAPNMWLEYVWINNAWEQWGTASVNLDGYATIDWTSSRYVSKRWRGKRALFFGTSITWYCMTGKANETDGYPQLVAEKLGLNFDTSRDVIGVTGAAIADSSNTATYGAIYTTINTTDTTAADIVCIEGGTNDFKLNVPLGAIGAMGDVTFDTSTFYGALRFSIEKILDENPDVQILLIADTQRDNAGYDVNYTNSAGCRMEDYVDAMIRVGNLYGIPVCDWYHKSGINEKNLDLYTVDGLHLNSAGYARVADLTAETLADIGSGSPMIYDSELKKKADKSSCVTATLGTMWSGTTVPYSQTLLVSGVSQNSLVEVKLPTNVTSEQRSAYRALSLTDGGQTTGRITLKAQGTLNTVEIPIEIIIRGDL